MSVKGGMTVMRNKLRDSPEVQKLYQHNRSGGLSAGGPGLSVFCDAMSAPEFQSQCMGNGPLKPSKFEKAAGPWREIKHKD